jgi:hypothetical protein
MVRQSVVLYLVARCIGYAGLLGQMQNCNSIASQNDGDLSEPEIAAGFYADDGVAIGHDPEQIQSGLDLAVELFERVGLKLNATKTKAMVCYLGSAQSRIS